MRLASFRWEGQERIGFALDDAHVADPPRSPPPWARRRRPPT
jgi:hypothetical protein